MRTIRFYGKWPVRSRVVLLCCVTAFPTASILRAEEPAAIVLDSRRDVDYAKENCLGQTSNTSVICQQQMIDEVNDFEDRLATYMAADAQCKGVRFVRYSGPSGNNHSINDVMQQTEYWVLSMNYQPGATKQPWVMLKNTNASTYTKGEGDPKEIAGNVCAIAIGRGAKLD